MAPENSNQSCGTDPPHFPWGGQQSDAKLKVGQDYRGWWMGLSAGLKPTSTTL